jgi:uncharacterized protein YbjQ (UPF0145 family)
MIERARVRLAKGVATGNVLVCHASHEAGTLAGVRQRILAGRGFDIVLFKRSLYMPRQRALLTLRQAAAALRAHGMIVVVHPERSLLRYAFAPPFGLTSYTPLHLVNRAISRLLEWSGMEEYTLYTCSELLALLREAVPGAQVQCLPSQQRPYNLVALQVP